MSKIKLTTDIVYDKNIRKTIKIIHIADIHFNKNMKKKTLDRVSNYIINMNADYVMVTGDIIDDAIIVKDSNKMKELAMFFEKVANTCKVIISLGNHDIIRGVGNTLSSLLVNINNVYLLNNSSYIDDSIYVFGVTLPREYYHNKFDENELLLLKCLGDNVNDILDDRFKIILIHSPIKLIDDRVLNKLKRFDLVLSGHTHDGLVPAMLSFMFPKNGGIVAPNKKLFPKIARGKIEKQIDNKKITFIITGGITKLSLSSARIFSKLNFLYNIGVNKILIRRSNDE